MSSTNHITDSKVYQLKTPTGLTNGDSSHQLSNPNLPSNFSPIQHNIFDQSPPQNYQVANSYPKSNERRTFRSTNQQPFSAYQDHEAAMSSQKQQINPNDKSYQSRIKNDQIKNEFIMKYIKDRNSQDYLPNIVKKKYSDGSKYFGNVDQFKANSGQGIYFIQNGDCYIGNFKEGKFEGNGTFLHSNGDRFEGNFEKGLRSGKGFYFFKNGDSFVGTWAENQRHGKGLLKIGATGEERQESYVLGIREELNH